MIIKSNFNVFIYAQQRRDDPHRTQSVQRDLEQCCQLNEAEVWKWRSEFGEVEDVMTTEKMAEIAIKVLCAGMSVAMSSLTEFAIGSAERDMQNMLSNGRMPLPSAPEF